MGVKFRRTLVTLAAAAGLMVIVPSAGQAAAAGETKIIMSATTSPLAGLWDGPFSYNWPLEPAVTISGDVENCSSLPGYGPYRYGGTLTQNGKTVRLFFSGALGGGEFECSNTTLDATFIGSDLKPGKATATLSIWSVDDQVVTTTATVTIPALPAKPRIDVAPITTKVFQGTPPDGSSSKTKAITSGAMITSCKPGTVYRVSARLNGQSSAPSSHPEQPTVNVTCSSKGVAAVVRTFYGDTIVAGRAKVLYFLTSPDSPTILAMDNKSVVIPK